jgi:hypothetical protein
MRDLAACCIAGAGSVSIRIVGPLHGARRFCWSVVETRNQSTGREPENLDIEQINEDRRKAIQQNIAVISVDT